MHGSVRFFLVLLCVGLVNAQARLTSTETIIGIALAIPATALVLCVLTITILYCVVRRKRAAENNQRAVTMRAQQRIQEPSTTLQQTHHINSLSPEATHTLENGVLHSTVPYPVESELQNAPPPTYSASVQYPVYTDKVSRNQSTSHGDEELPPPYIP